jgi:hypothetical protein
LAIITLAFGLAGCALPLKADPPGPDVPRISHLEFIPNRITASCPVAIRFDFEAPDGDLIRAVAYWRLMRRKVVASGYATLPVEPGVFAGRPHGEVNVPLTLIRWGTYWYYVQVEDAAGHKSNVRCAALLIDAPLPWAKTSPCK